MSTTAERLQLYQDAEAKILKGQTVHWADRQLTRANLKEVQDGIVVLQTMLAAENRRAAGQNSRAGYSVADLSR